MELAIAHLYREARVMMVIGVLLAVMVFAYIESRRELVAIDTISGKVVQVTEVNKTKNSRAFLARAIAVDGRQIQTFLPISPPRPSAGDTIPLVVEHYQDGTVLYRFDASNWAGSEAALRSQH